MSQVELLILDAKEPINLLELSTGWADESQWAEMPVEPGMYHAELAINPLRPEEGHWFFVRGSRIGQRTQWLIERKLMGVQVDLLEVSNVQASSTKTFQGTTATTAITQGRS
jgi:hypothetical protein